MTRTDFRESSSLSRPGNNWVYAWRNASATARHLNDGKLVVVVWGRDRSSFDEHKDDFCDTDDNAIADQECELGFDYSRVHARQHLQQPVEC